MSLLTTPYRIINTDKVEKYQEKLKQRKNNQEWILANYFGNPGGGAPIKDRSGQVITKIKTIADNNIYLYPSQEFTKVDIEAKQVRNDQHPIDQTIDDYSRIIPQQQHNQIDPIHQLQYQEYQLNPYQHQIAMLNQPPYPYSIPMHPHSIPFPYYPFPIYPTYPINIQPIPATSNIPPLLSVSNQSLPLPTQLSHPTNIKEDKIDFRKNNQITTYALPLENKDKNNKEVQKEMWKKELLIQMKEKKERERYEKKRFEESEIQDEIKYQEYLQIKKEQAEQQEQKRRNKIQKKAITQGNDNSDLGFMTKDNQYDSITNRVSSPIRNINNQPLMPSSSNQNNNLIMPIQNDDEYQHYNDFKSLVDSQYIALNQSLKEDFDKEMKKITADYNTKYQDEKKEAIAQMKDQPTQLTGQVIQSERKMKDLQDMIDQRRLVDFILDKDRNATSNTMPNINSEIDNTLSSYFGKNNDKQARFFNLQSASSFVYGNKLPYEEQKAVALPLNNGNNINQQNSVCFDKSLNTVSTFQPFVEEKMKRPKLIDSQRKHVNLEEKAYNEMFGKLDEITELSKKIDKTVKYQTIKSNFEIDLNHNQKPK